MIEKQPTVSHRHEASKPDRRRFQFTLKQLLLATAVVAALLGIWPRKVVTIRPARNDDPVRNRYFGIANEDAEIRNIVVAKGTFTKNTWLSASLLAVQAGQTHVMTEFTVGRSPNQLGSPPWQTLTLTLALGSWDTANGRIVQLGSAGHSRGTSRNSEWPVSFPCEFSNTFTGSITPAREYLIYAEGDTKVSMLPQMTVSEFTQNNAGNYLLVTARLN